MKPSIIPIPCKIRYLAGSSKITNQTEVFYNLNSSIEPKSYGLAIENNRVLISHSDASRQTKRPAVRVARTRVFRISIGSMAKMS